VVTPQSRSVRFEHVGGIGGHERGHDESDRSAHVRVAGPFPFRLAAGILKPKHTIIGTDIAGRVVAVGRRVTQLEPGDDVFGELSRSGFGGYAEYVVAPETALALKPSNASFEDDDVNLDLRVPCV
jgi:hypothetical protein